MEALDFVEIGGWVYNRLVPLGGKDRKAPPEWLAPLLFKVVPPLRARIQGNVAAVRADKAGRVIETWYTEWKPSLVRRNAMFGEVDLASLSDKALRAHFQALRDYYRETSGIHMMLNATLQFILADFFMGCQELLGWDEGRATDLLSGLSETSSAPARAMTTLAELVRENPRLRELLPAGNLRVAQADPQFAQAFAAYVRQWARRAVSYDHIDPTLAERPALLLSLIYDQVVQQYDGAADALALAAKRAEAAAAARAQLRRPADRERFEQLLRRAERAYPVREEHGFFDTSTPIALARYACLEAGRRLADRNQIARPEEIFFLEADEIEAAFDDNRLYKPLVDQRKGERSWVLAHPGPASYGVKLAPPSFAGLPPESRRMHEAVMWTMERVFAQATSQRKQTDASALTGIAAAPGQYTGPVRVIRDENEFGKIQPGDVLVCPITSPVWSILFASAGALVTDSGGTLSHSAIIAREYRIPAVVATGNATELLRGGQFVTVDGSTGQVQAAMEAPVRTTA